MPSYYVKEKPGKYRRPSTWAMVDAPSAEAAKMKYVRGHNASARVDYKGYPDLLKSHLLKITDVTVRSTPPQRGDISRYVGAPGGKVQYEDVYVSRPIYTPTIKAKIPRRKADQQLTALIKESQKIRMPFAYSDDLYKHDRSALAKHKPSAFVWVVRDWGTHLYPLDFNGTPLNKKQYAMYLSSIEYHAKHEKPCMFYIVRGTKATPVTPAAAIAAFEKAYPLY